MLTDCEIRKKRFERLREEKSSIFHVDHNAESFELTLLEKIKNLFEPLPFYEIIKRIKIKANENDVNANIHQLYRLEKWLKYSFSPNDLIIKPSFISNMKWYNKLKYWFNKNKLHNERKKLTLYFIKIIELKKQFYEIKYSDLSKLLVFLVQCYQKLIKNNKVTAYTIFHGPDDLGSHYLKSESVNYFFPDSWATNDMHVETDGTHSVHAAQGMHFKLAPSFPGVEYMVHALNARICPDISAPTKLVKVVRQDKAHLYLISQSIPGENFDFIYTHHPEYLDYLDPTNFSFIIFSGLLTDPFDGKCENIRVHCEWHPDGTVKRVKLVMIDNDRGFAIPICKRRGGHIVNVRYVPYLLNYMTHPIDSTAKNQLLSLPPATTVIQWLNDLQRHNHAYQKLHEEGIFTDDDMKACGLPIHLYEGTAINLYRKMVDLQSLLKNDTNDKLTHNDIFEKLQPIVYRFYQVILKNHDYSVIKSIDFLYKSIDSSAHNEALIENTLDLKEKLKPDETIEMSLEQQHEKFGDFEKRTQSVETARRDFISYVSKELLSPLDEAQLSHELKHRPYT